MPRTKRNVVADMVDLSIRLAAVLQNDTDAGLVKKYNLQASLRASCAEYPCENGTFYFKAAVKRMVVRLEFEGLEIAPGRRPHDPIRQSSEVTKVLDKSEVVTEANLAAAANLNLGLSKDAAAGGTAEANAKKSWRKSNVVEKTDEIVTRCVTAKPGDRWEIHDKKRTYLDATYLTEEDPLCDVSAQDRSNRRAVSAFAEVFQKDLHIEVSGFRKATTNKQKLAAIIVAKGINSNFGQPYVGKVILSHAEDSDD